MSKVDATGNNLITNKKQAFLRTGLLVIDKIAIIQYVLIYILIQYIGGRVLTAVGTDLFYSFAIVFSASLMLFFPKRLPLKKNFFVFLIVLSVSLLITFVITGGALYISTILSLVSRFLLVYVAIGIDPENFIKRFLKLVVLMSIISLLEFFFVLLVVERNALRLFSRLYEIKNAYSYLGSSYGLFFICYNFMDPLRNAYMFGEPGEYQALLITALYFLTFHKNNYESKLKIRYYIILILTLISTQSTTGYFNLIAFAIVVLLANKKSISPIVRNIIICGIIILVVYLIFWYSDDSFLYRNFIEKITGDSGNVDLTVDTGAARIGPIKRFWQTLTTAPHKLIFGVGYDGLFALPLQGYTTCGLINSIAMTGFVSSFILYGEMFLKLIKNSNSFGQVVFALFVIINMGLSQPDILSIVSVLICMCGLWIKHNNKPNIHQTGVFRFNN